jgi:uncharacterized protein (TIGR01777 family)
MPVPVGELFAWHERPGAFERLSPPWDRARVISRRGGIEDGAEVTVQVSLGPLRTRWVVQHFDYLAGRRFRDRMLRGPFAHWVHTHAFEASGPDSSILEDSVEYALPGRAAGALLGGGFAGRTLERVFAYRHAVTRADLERHRAAGLTPQRIAITGASGLIGSALASFLTTGGHQVLRLTRSRAAPAPGGIFWNPAAGEIDRAGLEGLDAVIHLAGENISAGRWSPARKAAIRSSRERATGLLAQTLAALQRPPRTLLSASATGYYGDTAQAWVDEASEPGTGFLADVCRAWEEAAAPAAAAGIRVVRVRIGPVITAAAGMLARLLPLYRAGLGGPAGTGREYLSWISLDDLLGVFLHLLAREEVSGPVNAVAPAPVTGAEFARTLARVLRRPASLRVPSVALRLAFGKMAEETLLASQRVRPAALPASGFSFRHPTLESALRHELGLPGRQK